MKKIHRNRCGAFVLATVLTTSTLASVPALASEEIELANSKIVLITEYISVELEEGITLEEYARLQMLSLAEEQIAGLSFVTEFVMDAPAELAAVDLTVCKGLGTFGFADPVFIPEKGVTTCEVVFTPDDAAAFHYENMMGWNAETNTVHRYVQVYCTSLMTEEEKLAKAQRDAAKEADGLENDTVNEQGILEDSIILAPGITVNPDAVIMEETENPGETAAPEVTVIPEVTVVPEVTVTPEVTIVPEVTVVPEATVTPEVTVVPEATVTPEATVVPETTVAPEVTVVPEATVAPESTETAVDVQTPEVTVTLESVIPEATEEAEGNGLISEREEISSPFNVAGSNVLVGGSDKSPVTPTPTATPTPKPTTTVAPTATPTPKPTTSTNNTTSTTNKNNTSSTNKNGNKTTAAKTGDEAQKSRFMMLGMSAFAMMTAAGTILVRRSKLEDN